MGEVVVRSEVDDTLDTRDHAQDKLEVLEEQKEHVDNDQNKPKTKINSNFEASLNLESRENVCKPGVVTSNKKPTVTELIKDNRERDDGYWEVFTVSSPKNKMMFNLWLADNRPSVIRSNEVGGICIELDSDGQSKGISIYKFGLSVCLFVCLFVCLYPINVKTAELVGPKFFVGHLGTPGKVYESS